MKKLIALLVVLGFMVGVAGIFTAEAATAKVAKKAVKKVMKKKAMKKAAPKAAPKKAAPAPTPVAPIAPPPPPVAPIAPRAPIVAKPATPALFGLGVNTALTGGYISTGKGSLSGSFVARGDVMLDDMVGLGPMVGLSANSIKYSVGLGYVAGGIKAVPLYVGGIINLPADAMGGIETYLAGGLNYTVYGNGSNPGGLGGDASIGVKVDLGLGLGKTGIALGWGAVKSKTVTSKGFMFSVSQPITL